MALGIVLWPTPPGVLLAIGVGIAAQVLLEKWRPAAMRSPGTHAKADWASRGPTPATLHGHAGAQDRRIGGVGEIGMGGPSYWTLLLRDGALLHGVCSAVHDLDGGRLRIALGQTRHGNPLLVYDVAAACIHVLESIQDGRTPDALFRDACADPVGHAGPVRAACVRAARTIALHTVLGLRVPRADHPHAPAERLVRPLRDGRVLQAQLLLPADLRGAADPERLLAHPPYELQLDGRPAGLHVHALQEVHESARGECVVLAGVQLDAGGGAVDGLWHVLYRERWHAVLGHALRPCDGGGSYMPYFLQPQEIGDAGALCFELSTCAFGPEGQLPSEPAPPVVELPVSWQPAPLRLATDANRIRFELPQG